MPFLPVLIFMTKLLLYRQHVYWMLLNYIWFISKNKQSLCQKANNWGIHHWHMIFGLEQEGGSLITPMALAHPLHPIDNRSRNKRRNLWVGRCVSSWWPWFPSRNSVLIYMYIYVYIPYTSSVIGRIYNGSVIQYWRSCTPSRSIGECAVPDLNAILCFLWFTNCVLLFDNNLILGCLWHVFV